MIKNKLKYSFNQKTILILLIVLIVIFAAVPRFVGLDKFSLTVDEPVWRLRGETYISSIVRLNFSKAYTSPHPGIPTAILVGLSSKALLSTKLLNGPYAQIIAARLPMALANTILIAIFFLLSRKIWTTETAFVASLLLSLSPFNIALSRIAHLDSLLSLFMAISVLSFMVGENNNEPKYKLISGIFFGLGFLSKPTAILVPVIIVFWKLFLTLREKGINQTLRNPISKFDAWDMSAIVLGLVLFIAFFPQMWGNPFYKIWSHISRSSAGAMSGHLNFFLGKVTNTPSKLFYPIIIFFRSSEIMIFGVISAAIVELISLVRKNKMDSKAVLLIIWFSLIFIVISQGTKTGDRYMLPVWPALAIISAMGIIKTIRYIQTKIFIIKKVSVGILASLLILVVNTPIVFAYYPNYYLYYNQFIKGPAGAKNIIQIGLGEGHKKAFEYLSTIVKKNETVALLGYDGVARSYYQGKLYSIEDKNKDTEWKKADYLVIIIAHRQRFPKSPAVRYADKHKPLKVIRLNGNIAVTWIYKISHD